MKLQCTKRRLMTCRPLVSFRRVGKGVRRFSSHKGVGKVPLLVTETYLTDLGFQVFKMTKLVVPC